jgi:tetratricopeptide (TPR) repeat protein
MWILPTTARRGLLSLTIVAVLSAAAAWSFSTRPKPIDLIREAEAELQAGRFEAARTCVGRLERLRPPTPHDRMLRARIASAVGDDPGAIEDLGTIADDPELGAQALFMIGLIERRRQRVRHAEAAYRKAIERDPNLLKARKELIFILGMQFRRREVDAAFKALARVTPLTQYDLYTWGLTHYVVWGPDSAQALESFIAADPEDRYSRLALATLLLAQPGQEARVAEVLAPLPQDDPDVLALRIEQALNVGRVDEAAAMIAKAPSDDARLARLRGRLAIGRGDRAAAVRYYRQALSDEPYDRVSLSELGKALLLQGDRAGAEVYLGRARQLDEVYNLLTRIGKPKQDVAAPDLDRIAQACEAAGLNDEAQGWYMLAIGRNPLDPEAQRGLHRLRPANTSTPPDTQGRRASAAAPRSRGRALEPVTPRDLSLRA